MSKRQQDKEDMGFRQNDNQPLKKQKTAAPPTPRSKKTMESISGGIDTIDLTTEETHISNFEAKLMRRTTRLLSLPSDNGDVYIQLGARSTEYSYRLECDQLSHYRSFHTMLNNPVWRELDDEIAMRVSIQTGIVARFELFWDPKVKFEVLKRTVLTQIKDRSSQNTRQQPDHLESKGQMREDQPGVTGSVDGQTRQVAERNGDPSMDLQSRAEGYSAEARNGKIPIADPNKDILAAYDRMLRMYRDEPPKFTTTDINLALGEMELFVRVNELSGSWRTACTRIGKVWSTYQREMPSAILSDPLRWILLAVKLEDDKLYKAAMRHFDSNEHPSSSLLLNNWGLLKHIEPSMRLTKDRIEKRRSEINGRLMRNQILVDQRCSETVNYLTAWHANHIWCAWLEGQLTKAREAPVAHRKVGDEALYNLIAEGKAYLSDDTAFIDLVWGEGSPTLKQIDKTQVKRLLSLLEMQARSIVKPLYTNTLSSSKTLDTKYLTWHEILDDELPWNNSLFTLAVKEGLLL